MRIQLEQMLAKLNGIEENVDALSKRVEAQDKFSKAIEEENLDRKITLYTAAIELDPDYAHAFNNRGNAYNKKGKYDRAIADYDRAIELAPDNADAFNSRGIAYTELGKYDRAIADYDRAIELDPDHADAFNNRGFAYGNKGEYDRAIANYDRAIELDPDDALALNNKAWLLAAAGDPQVRDGQEAVRLARESVHLGDAPEYRDTLAAAYAEAGQFDDAIAEQERAMEMLREAGRHNEIADFQTRLNLYRSHQPYRQ